jgi:prepilin-type N-terminal cleavage/methylation domain-containing protein
MQMLKKYLKNNKGFTLVEVIVVAVIVLVLAAVAIPLYTGYVKDSRRATAENLAGQIASTLGAAKQTGIESWAVNNNGDAATMTTAQIPKGYLGAEQILTINLPKGFTVTANANGTSVQVSHADFTEVVTAGF